MALLTVENLTKIFTVGKGEELIAVNNVSFALERGETLGLVGESGSGKTTVGRCVLRLIEPTEGRIALGNQQISELDPAALRELRARMQLVFQDPFGSLNPRLTVFQTVDEPLALHGMGRAERRPRVGAMLERAETARERMGLTHVEFREGFIEALPLEADTVDVILSNCVINLTPDKAPVFREAFRVLKPGGRLALSDIVRVGEFSPALMADRGKWSECVTGAIPLADYTSLMREAGFVEIEVPDMRNADGIIPIQPGMPPLFSARITARKPQA